MKKLFSIALVLGIMSVALFIQGCSSGQNDKQSTESEAGVSEGTEETLQEVNAISLWEGISVRQAPSKEGKWLSSITLGESVTHTGQSAVDSTDKNRGYVYVVLSDGTEGWSVDYGLAIDAKLAATKEEAVIYKRPDLLTVTEDKIPVMSMVAVEEESGDFVKVLGKERKKKGWIEKSKLVLDDKEVAVAVLAEKQLKKNGSNYSQEALSGFLETVPYKSTNFYNTLMDELNSMEMELEEDDFSEEEMSEDTVSME
jgi:hypothetical protein